MNLTEARERYRRMKMKNVNIPPLGYTTLTMLRDFLIDNFRIKTIFKDIKDTLADRGVYRREIYLNEEKTCKRGYLCIPKTYIAERLLEKNRAIIEK